MRGPLAWRIAAAALAAAIVVLGVLPTQDAVEAVSGGRDDLITTAGHFASYAVFAFVVAAALGGWRATRRTIVGSAALAVSLGVAIELVQALLPYRDCQIADALVDAGGAALGLVVFSVVVRARAC